MEFPLKPFSPWTFCRRLPNPLVYLSYIFYFQGILVGPLCFYTDYIDFIEGSNFQVKQVGPTVVEANGEMVIVSVLPEVYFCLYLYTGYSQVLKKFVLKYPMCECHIKIKLGIREISYMRPMRTSTHPWTKTNVWTSQAFIH